jgi:hypothetical protein
MTMHRSVGDITVGVATKGASPIAHLQRQRRFFGVLAELRKEGLSLTRAVQLLRTWAQGASVHILRAVPVATAWAQAVEADAIDLLTPILGKMNERQVNQLFIPIKAGGLALDQPCCEQHRLSSQHGKPDSTKWPLEWSSGPSGPIV